MQWVPSNIPTQYMLTGNKRCSELHTYETKKERKKETIWFLKTASGSTHVMQKNVNVIWIITHIKSTRSQGKCLSIIRLKMRNVTQIYLTLAIVFLKILVLFFSLCSKKNKHNLALWRLWGTVCLRSWLKVFLLPSFLLLQKQIPANDLLWKKMKITAGYILQAIHSWANIELKWANTARVTRT